MRKSVLIILVLGIVFGISIVFYEIVDMLIDHQCYQLEPNEKYRKTICEKYWKNKGKEVKENEKKQ